MKKIFLLYIVLIFSTHSNSQSFKWSISEKNKVDEEGKKFLKVQAGRCVGQVMNFTFNITTDDLKYNPELTAKDIPSSLENVQSIIDTLKNKNYLPESYYQIAQIFGRLNLNVQKDTYLKKAISALDNLLQIDSLNLNYIRRKAQFLTNKGEYSDAIKLYNKVLSYKANDTVSIAAIGAIYLLNLQQYAEAEKCFKKVLLLDPLNYTAFLMLSMVEMYNTMPKFNQFQAEEIQQMRLDDLYNFQFIEPTLNKFPKDIRLQIVYYLTRINFLSIKLSMQLSDNILVNSSPVFSKPDIAEITALRKFINKANKDKNLPNYYILPFAKACLDVYEKKFIDAIESYKIALNERNTIPNNFQYNSGIFYDDLMIAYMLNDDTINAIKVFEEKIKNKPLIDENPSDYCQLAKMQLNVNPSKAKENFDHTLNLQNNNTFAMRGLAILLIRNGNITGAIQFCNKAISINKNEIDSYLLLGICYMLQDSKAFAYDYFKTASKINPEDEVLQKIMDYFFVRY